LNNDFNVVNMRVLKQDETPGLGTLCMEPSFAERYKGKKPSDLKISSDGGEIETILGATITTNAVTKCLSSAVEKLQSDLKSSSAGGSR
jgi:electron transport complex protein RnfG